MSVLAATYQLRAAIAADDLVSFARAFTALVALLGVEPAKRVAEALIAERAAGQGRRGEAGWPARPL